MSHFDPGLAFRRARNCGLRREQERHCRIIAMSMFQREPRDLGVLENNLVCAQEKQFWGDLLYPPITIFWHLEPDATGNPYELPPIELPEPHPFDPEND